jgi:cell division protein FtsX
MFDDLSRPSNTSFESDLDDRFLDEMLAAEAGLPTAKVATSAKHTVASVRQPERRILGMTAWQRLFLTLALFFNILLLGTLCLLITNTVQLPWLR